MLKEDKVLATSTQHFYSLYKIMFACGITIYDQNCENEAEEHI